MPNSILQWPYLRLLIPFSIGIISGILWPTFAIVLPGIVAVAIFIVVSMILQSRSGKSREKQYWFGMILCIGLYVAGVSIATISTPGFHHNHYSRHLQNSQWLIGSVNQPPVEKTATIKLKVSVEVIGGRNNQHPCSGTIIAYLTKNEHSEQIGSGDQLMLSASALTPIAPPQNPYEFDYQAFLKNQGIQHQGFYHTNNWQLLNKRQSYSILNYIYAWREQASNILHDHIRSTEAYAIASTLLLGMRENIPADINQSYASTGIIHILAISGLHVGILYLLLSFLFQAVPKNLKWLSGSLTVMIIWGFALLTGLTPSVLRAAVMFTFLILADHHAKSMNRYNALAASAFVLLLFNPYQITEVGFQLSYIAVAGILLIYQPLYNLLYSPVWLVDKVWSITALSLAAQLATFPLVIFYFHQFPTYFLLANLVAIPSAFISLIVGLSLLATSWAPPIADALGIILEMIIDAFHHLIRVIEHLPLVKIEGAIDIGDMILLYLILISALVFLVGKYKTGLIYTLVFTLVALVTFTFSDLQQINQQEIIVYNVKGHAAYDLIDGREHIFMQEPALSPQEIDYHIKPNWLHKGLSPGGEQYGQKNIFRSGQFMLFHDTRLAIIDTAIAMKNKASPIKVDLLFISQNPKVTIDELLTLYEPNLVIFDASNYPKRTANWQATCDSIEINSYDVRENGALVYDLLDN